MVGLVIVSHSRALAEALLVLTRQMASGDLAIAVAAGVGPDREEIGTDAVEISEAIQAVYSEDGVVVLMDLGSAILSAQLALELLPPEMAGKVIFCPAPVVEGAIAAAVQASLGSPASQVCAEASQALLPKIEQIAPEQATAAAEPLVPAQTEGTEQSIELVLRNPHGLHARPAARFVQTAGGYPAEVRVRNLTTGKGPVSARSLNALATLGAVNGHRIQISASGPQAGEALHALRELVEANFGEGEATAEEVAAAPAPEIVSEIAPARPGQRLRVIPVSEGIALGPLFHYRPPLPHIPDEPAGDPQSEWERLQGAIQTAAAGIRQRGQSLRGVVGADSASIFEAHQLILQDPELLDQVRARIFDLRENAARAWDRVIQAIAEGYRHLGDPYLAQRAADVLDVGAQVLFALSGHPAAAQVKLPGRVVLFAEELTPTETAGLDMQQVLGLVTVKGGPTSHSAILSRALSIPAVTGGASAALRDLPDGAQVGLDGFGGGLWIEPAEAEQARLSEQRQAWIEQRQTLLNASRGEARTRDGRRVEIAANIGGLADAHAAVENGAEGVGLLRTEFLFLSRTEPPTEDEQADLLQSIVETMQGRTVIVRTLDVGGDKFLPYLNLPVEDNPFLGVRAIRLSLRRPEIFLTQLRAILRAGAAGPVRIMFPMVANLEEVAQARALLAEAHLALEARKVPHLWPVETGIMIEVPAAAILSDQFARQVDFFSIGTNDLAQYTLAAERGNPELASLADALHPAVLSLIQQVTDAAHRYGKWAGVCGELAGDPLAAPVLTGLGIDELSLNPAGIPRIKQVIRSLDSTAARDLAVKARALESAAAVRTLATQFLASLKAG